MTYFKTLGLMSQVVGLPNNSYKPITNMGWVRARLCKLQKRCTRLAVASDKVYQLLAHGRWFSPASSTTKTGRHDIAEILLNAALTTKNQSIKIKPLNFLIDSICEVSWKDLQMEWTSAHINANVFVFHSQAVPSLRMGTLDSCPGAP